MATDEEPTKRHQFDTTVDVAATLETLGGSDHLDITEDRAIVIYNRGILNLKVTSGELDSAREVTIEVFDLPPGKADTKAITFIEKFITRLREANERTVP